jgi:hypothetical protein
MELPEIGATLRSYVSRSGALQAVAAVPAGIVTCDGDGVVTVQQDEDDEAVALEWRGAQAAELSIEPKRLPPFDADAIAGEVSGPLGGLEHVAEGVLALAEVLGAPGVALTWMPTLDGETTFALSARAGEGVVIVIGDEVYEMDEGWPPRRPAP